MKYWWTTTFVYIWSIPYAANSWLVWYSGTSFIQTPNIQTLSQQKIEKKLQVTA